MSTAAILIGERARRLGGRAKPFLPIGDQRIIDRQIAVLRTVTDEISVVVANADQYDELGLSV